VVVYADGDATIEVTTLSTLLGVSLADQGEGVLVIRNDGSE
jgi:septum formation inhibitor-activating ATPase MinD